MPDGNICIHPVMTGAGLKCCGCKRPKAEEEIMKYAFESQIGLEGFDSLADLEDHLYRSDGYVKIKLYTGGSDKIIVIVERPKL